VDHQVNDRKDIGVGYGGCPFYPAWNKFGKI